MGWRDTIIEATVGDDTDVYSRIEAAQASIWALRQIALDAGPLTQVHAPAALHQLAVRAPLLQRRRLRRIARRFADARERLLTEPPDRAGAIAILDVLRTDLDAAADRLAARSNIVRRLLAASVLPIAIITAILAWWLRQPKPIEPVAIDAVAAGLRLAPVDGGFAARDAQSEAVFRHAAEVYFGHAEPSASLPSLAAQIRLRNPSYGAAAALGPITVEAIRDAEPFPYDQLPVDVGLRVATSGDLPSITAEKLGPVLDLKVILSHAERSKALDTWTVDSVPPRGRIELVELVEDQGRWDVLAVDDAGAFEAQYARLARPVDGLTTFKISGDPRDKCVASDADRGLWAEVADVDALRRVPGVEVLWRTPIKLHAAGLDLRGEAVEVRWRGVSGSAKAWHRGAELRRDKPRCIDPSVRGPDDPQKVFDGGAMKRLAFEAAPRLAMPAPPEMIGSAVERAKSLALDAMTEALGIEKPSPLPAEQLIDVELESDAGSVPRGGRIAVARLVKARLAAGGLLRVGVNLTNPGSGGWTIAWYVGHRELGRTTIRLPLRLPADVRYATDGVERARARLSEASK